MNYLEICDIPFCFGLQFSFAMIREQYVASFSWTILKFASMIQYVIYVNESFMHIWK